MTHWRTIDFRPAAPGWRVIYLNRAGDGTETLPLAGWLIEEEADGDFEALTGIPHHDRNRRIVPGIWAAGIGMDVVPADEDGDGPSWVLAASDPDPDEAQIAQARTDRDQSRAVRERMRQRREQRP